MFNNKIARPSTITESKIVVLAGCRDFRICSFHFLLEVQRNAYARVVFVPSKLLAQIHEQDLLLIPMSM